MSNKENKALDKIEFVQKRLEAKIQKPVIIYKKKSGEVVRAILSSKVEEIQKVDRRSLEVLELEEDFLPQNIHDKIVINGILKEKPKEMLVAKQKGFLEQQLVILNMQLETANKNNLQEASTNLVNRIKDIKKKIKDLGVE